MDAVRNLFRLLQQNRYIGFVLVAFLSWAIEARFSQTFNESGAWGVVKFLAVVLAPVLLVVLGHRLWQELRPSRSVLVGKMPPAQPGLIFLYSNKETLRKAVAHHRPKLQRLWLIVTTQTGDEASQMVRELELTGMADAQTVQNFWEPDETAAAIRRVVQHAADVGLRRSGLICDITGGTKSMTIGAIAACASERIRIEMVPAEYTADRRPKKPLDVIELKI